MPDGEGQAVGNNGKPRRPEKKGSREGQAKPNSQQSRQAKPNPPNPQSNTDLGTIKLASEAMEH